VLVPARIEEGQIGLFLLDPRADGVSLEPQRTTRGELEFRMTLSGVQVEDEQLLGSPEEGTEILRWVTERGIAGLCATQVGVSERALRMTADYTSSRLQFDRPIGSFQAVHQRAADAYIDVEAMRLTTWQAAWRLAAGEPAEAEVAVAKFWAAEGGHSVGYAAQHLHGGIGVDVDYPLHRCTLWSKQIELSLGSATRQLARLGAILASQTTEASA
jgi:alkylation response protein AidB-like acyl-CoA dehydrogenase